MKQALFIDGMEVRYSLETKNIALVLGSGFIYQRPTFMEILEIVYRGLKSTGGYRLEEFQIQYLNGKIFTSRRKGHYTMSLVRRLIQERIKQMNRERNAKPLL